MYSDIAKRDCLIDLDGRGDAPVQAVGAKGAAIHTMCHLGISVPPAFAISTTLCDRYRREGELTKAYWSNIRDRIHALGEQTREALGEERPLLVSVRSSGVRSMPGMLDTFLNVDVADQRLAQFRTALGSVVGSWTGERARAYRSWAGIGDFPGTAVIVHAMVFAEGGPVSGAGVATLVEGHIVGEWLEGAAGTALMSGAATPAPLSGLKTRAPGVVAELKAAQKLLEAELGGRVEVEFTVEEGRLFVLQSRLVPAPPAVALDPAGPDDQGIGVLLSGVPASPGLGCGLASTAPLPSTEGDDPARTILVRETTSPEDVPQMLSAQAVVTERGGFTSHAAVVCREAGIPCVVGCGPGVFDLVGRRVVVDGSTGKVSRAA